jgi:UDP-N-acetylmuramoylalanine--D-glutamate ligase
MTINRALQNFRGLDHRIQFVAEVAGRRFYNDSKSTSPQATLAALAALDGPLWLLAGGHPKGARFEELARAVVRRTRGAGLFGLARETLCDCLRSQSAGFNAAATEYLDDALDGCWRQSQPGDVILLSPACASYDQFRDFEARGEAFCRWVAALRARVEK